MIVKAKYSSKRFQGTSNNLGFHRRPGEGRDPFLNPHFQATYSKHLR